MYVFDLLVFSLYDTERKSNGLRATSNVAVLKSVNLGCLFFSFELRYLNAFSDRFWTLEVWKTESVPTQGIQLSNLITFCRL